MKITSELGRYAELWNASKGEVFQLFVENPDLLTHNYRFWETQCDVADMPTVSQPDGTANFKTESYVKEGARLMSGRADMADVNEISRGNDSFYTGSIFGFGEGFKETAMERRYKEKLFEQFGRDASFIRKFVVDLQNLNDMADMALSNMTGQLFSKGNIIYNYGLGVKDYHQKVDIPSAHFKNFGEKAVTDTSCDILKQTAKLVSDYKMEHGDIPVVVKVPKETFLENWLANAKVVAWVKQYRTVRDETFIDGANVTQDLFMTAVADYPGMTTIEIIDEKERDHNGNDVQGWANNVMVICPAGKQGLIQWTVPLDVEILSQYKVNTIERIFAQLDGGIKQVCNSTIMTGELPEWHTDLLMKAVPTLRDYPYHWIINMSTAD